MCVCLCVCVCVCVCVCIQVAAGSLEVVLSAPESAAQEIQRQALDPKPRRLSGSLTEFTDIITLPTPAGMPKPTTPELPRTAAPAGGGVGGGHTLGGANVPAPSLLAALSKGEKIEQKDAREVRDAQMPASRDGNIGNSVFCVSIRTFVLATQVVLYW